MRGLFGHSPAEKRTERDEDLRDEDGDSAKTDTLSEFDASLSGLKKAASAEYFEQSVKLGESVEATRKTAQNLILYADDILENAVVVDLEDTVKKILERNNVLEGGKIIIYGRGPANAAILEKLIKRSGPDINTVTITESELKTGRTIAGELDELDALMRFASAKGAKDVLAVVKGATSQPEALVERAKELKIPVILIGPEKGIYSFAQALAMAIRTKEDGGRNGWVVLLPVLKPLTEDLQRCYDEYRRSLEALRAA
jgi:hypothetical protein